MTVYYNQGTYPVRIVEQYWDETEYGMQFCLKILPTNVEQPYERTVYLSFTDADGNKAQFYEKTLDVLAHLGFAEDRFEKLDPRHPQCVNFVDTEITAYCKHKPDGKGGAKEAWYINVPKDKYEPKPVESSQLRKLNALFGKDMKERAKVGGVAKPAKPPVQTPVQPPVPEPPQDNSGPDPDIPF
jgi:hypothetical protein